MGCKLYSTACGGKVKVEGLGVRGVPPKPKPSYRPQALNLQTAKVERLS